MIGPHIDNHLGWPSASYPCWAGNAWTVGKDSQQLLTTEVADWQQSRNEAEVCVDWQFRTRRRTHQTQTTISHANRLRQRAGDGPLDPSFIMRSVVGTHSDDVGQSRMPSPRGSFSNVIDWADLPNDNRTTLARTEPHAFHTT